MAVLSRSRKKFILAELIQGRGAKKFDLAIATREIRLRTELASGLAFG